MAKPEKMASGKWRIRVYIGKIDGKDKYKSVTGNTKREAEQLAAKVLIEEERSRQSDLITLGQAMDNFIDNKTAILSPASIATYRSLRRTAYSSIIDKRLGSLTTDDIRKCINEYATNHKAKGTHNMHGFLSSVVKEAYPSLDTNVTLPKKEKNFVNLISDEDLSLLLANAKGTPLYLPILFAAELGMRRGEICALTGDDVDIKKKVLRINKTVVRDEIGSYVVKSPKTYDSTRIIRLTTNIIKALPKKMSPDQRIVELTPNELSDKFAYLVDKSRIPHVSFHSLRHYNASIMLKLGVPDKYAMERGGWSTNNVMKTVYQQTFTSESDAIADKIDKYFSK